MQRLMVLVLVAVLGFLGAAGTTGAAPPDDARVPAPTLPGMDEMMAQNERDARELRGLSGGDLEVAYMQLMRGHHMAAVEMAELVSSRAAHPEVAQLARTIVADQQREIGQLEGWLRDWHGVASPMMMPMAGMDEMIPALRRLTGFEFEQAFLLMMVHHHQGAIDMSAVLPGRTTRPELLQFGSNVIAAQVREVQQMRDWAMSWYGFDPLPMSQEGHGGHGGPPVMAMPNTGAGGVARQTVGLAPIVAGLTALSTLLLVGGSVLRRKVSRR